VKSVIIIAFIIIQQTSFGQLEKYSSFEQLDSLWAGYMLNNQLDSATLVFEYAQKEYPERDKDITYTLGFLYALTKRDSLALVMWSYGQPKGYYFGLNRYRNNEQFKNNKKFIALAGRDKQIGDSLNNLSHVEYEIRLPENYSINKSYPIVFVFHGNGSKMEMSKVNWTSELMHEDFIAV